LIYLIAAILLSLERIAYVWVSRRPESFRAICQHGLGGMLGQPTAAIRRLFYVFKVLQVSTFVGWCYYFGRGSLVSVQGSLVPVTIGMMLVIIGQVLNFGVFYRLGSLGVFYGNRFGHEIPWCREFPFSLIQSSAIHRCSRLNLGLFHSHVFSISQLVPAAWPRNCLLQHRRLPRKLAPYISCRL
jgi:phosphatidyl-N-methylethanolamine N-methyltransferase